MNYNWHALDIRKSAAGISVLLSVFMVVKGWLPNEDAFTYIRTVEVFLDEGLAAAYSHYPWATYPVLIGSLQRLLPLDPFHAAVAVNAAFYALLVYAFISLVAEIDDNRTTLLLAAVTILVYPQLNENRLIIIRDSAFWALALFGLWQYLQYLRSWRLQHAAGFSLAYLLAAAFRAEALVFLFAIPVSLLADQRLSPRRRARLSALFTASSAAIVVSLVMLAALTGLNLPALLTDQLAVYLPFARDTFFPPETRTSELGRAIFGDYAANFTSDYLPLFMTTGLLAVLVAFVVKGIGGPMLIVLLTGLARRLRVIPRWQLLPLLVVVLANALIALAFLVTTRFLSSRYVILMCLVCVVAVPLLLASMQKMAGAAGRARRSNWLIGLLLGYCAIDAYISFGANKEYLREAGSWIAQYSQSGEELLTNNRTIAYYSGRVEDYDLIPVLLSAAEVLAMPAGSLVAFEEDTSTIGLFNADRLARGVQELVRFGPDSGRQVVIYRRLADSQR